MEHQVGEFVFAWDETKAEANSAKHGVTFIDAATVFADPLARIYDDPDHSENEQRCLLVGQSFAGKILVVAHAGEGGRIRIISAREATRTERRSFEQDA